MKRLNNLINNLNVPKSHYNNFGKYHYRNTEDILNAVKPGLCESGLYLHIADEIKQIGERYYIIATVSIIDCETNKVIDSATGFAREPENKKGMDSAQVTGATSSYARKYALNALFKIDDVKDPDSDNNSSNNSSISNVINKIKSAKNMQELEIIKTEIKNSGVQFQPEESEKIKNAYEEKRGELT